ncbi:MAG: AraC family transcriptional regulator [Cyanobacteriota bacterium]
MPHYSALKSELKSEGQGSRLYVESLATALGVHLLRHYCTSSLQIPTYSDGLSRRKLRLVIEYIKDNLERDLRLAQMAAFVGMSPYHFARLFKLSTGQSPHQYVTHYRIECAKQLLANTDLAITEIAYRVGFSSPSHLTRVFRQYTSITPKAYRDTL